jgi:hypothetical protein
MTKEPQKRRRGRRLPQNPLPLELFNRATDARAFRRSVDHHRLPNDLAYGDGSKLVDAAVDPIVQILTVGGYSL